jgi:hypothetical protein
VYPSEVLMDGMKKPLKTIEKKKKLGLGVDLATSKILIFFLNNF